ncbi:hypothetical protein L5515_002594 [Caenorhabditis briggsae]|uniref:DUF7778 domain-containing protein n=1 Tax=Caenorhabditis briggsae TaxID=6238 RepID=A0AAE9J595_CAEBR|nr:hypothetical protein L5515_002594 [Caenorhabditis briggsae]
MSADQSMHHHHSTTLHVAKRLDKYIDLPPRPQYKLSNVLQRGNVHCFIRSKASFFAFPDNITKMKSRFLNVTTNGYLIIYMNSSKGLVVDLRQAINVFCNADRFVQKSKKIDSLRCHLKIRLQHGNIHIFVRDDEVHKWTCAIMKASAKPKPMRMSTRDSEEEEGILMTAVEQEDSGNFEEMTPSASTAPESCHEVLGEEEEETSDVVNTVIERPECAPEPTTTTSVRSLCQKLEHSLRIKSKDQVLSERRYRNPSISTPQFVSELFHEPQGEFCEETIVVLEPTNPKEKAEQQEEVDRENTWWTRSLRC